MITGVSVDVIWKALTKRLSGYRLSSFDLYTLFDIDEFIKTHKYTSLTEDTMYVLANIFEIREAIRPFGGNLVIDWLHKTCNTNLRMGGRELIGYVKRLNKSYSLPHGVLSGEEQLVFLELFQLEDLDDDYTIEAYDIILGWSNSIEHVNKAQSLVDKFKKNPKFKK
jgi:hypothetical protein